MRPVYSSSKIFHFQSKLRDMLAGRPSAPIHVRLKPTNRCSHGCSYCCYRNPDLHLAEQMKENDQIPQNKMKEIVADFSAMGVKAVTFSGGGEPLGYPHIYEAIQDLHRGGIKVAVLTNGVQLSGALADLISTNAVWVRVSMDCASPEAFAKSHRSSANTFQIICRNIAEFAKMKKRSCVLGVNYVVTRENHQDVFKFLEIMKSLGVDHVKVSEAVVSMKEEENIRYVKAFQEVVQEQLKQAQSQLAGNGFSIVDMMLDLTSASQISSGYQKQYSSCPHIQYLTVVAADMNIYTCQDKAYSQGGYLGSFADRRFKDVWFDETTWQRLRTLDPNSECCHHCTAHGKNLLLREFLDADPDHLDFV